MNDFIVQMIEQGGYWGVAFLAALENIFPPLPSELIMGVGGIKAGQGVFDVWLVALAGTVGTVVGNYFWYWLGLHYSGARLETFIHRHGRWLTLDMHDVERLNRLFWKYGFGIIFVARFMPAMRTMISLPAGLFHMPHWQFFLATAAGSFIWNAGLAWAGYWLGASFTDIDRYLAPASWLVIAVMAVAYLWRVATWTPKGDSD